MRDRANLEEEIRRLMAGRVLDLTTRREIRDLIAKRLVDMERETTRLVVDADAEVVDGLPGRLTARVTRVPKRRR